MAYPASDCYSKYIGADRYIYQNSHYWVRSDYGCTTNTQLFYPGTSHDDGLDLTTYGVSFLLVLLTVCIIFAARFRKQIQEGALQLVTRITWYFDSKQRVRSAREDVLTAWSQLNNATLIGTHISLVSSGLSGEQGAVLSKMWESTRSAIEDADNRVASLLSEPTPRFYDYWGYRDVHRYERLCRKTGFMINRALGQLNASRRCCAELAGDALVLTTFTTVAQYVALRELRALPDGA